MRFSSLLLSLLLAARFVHADPEPADQSQSTTQAVTADEEITRPLTAAEAAFDEDGDGKLSRRENRRKRRAERRARRRAQGLPDDDQEEVDPAEQARREQRRQAALKRAGAMAQQMKQDTPQDDGGPAGSSGASSSSGGRSASSGGGGGGSGAGSLAAGGVANAPTNFHATPGAPPSAGRLQPGAQAPSSPSGDPANPRTPEDFLLAVRGGYAPALGKAGLRLSADGRSIVRSDGSAATADDYARLGREIRSMPAALSTRPDFFTRVSPAHYGDLKREYSERGPELSKTVFKHVGETEDARDFVHSASCSKLSGECNASVERESYKKGEFVDPKDLDKMWSALESELGEDKPKEGGVDDRTAAAPAAAPTASASAGLPDPTLAPEGRPGTGSAQDRTTAAEQKAAAASSPAVVVSQAARRVWTGVTAAFSGESTPEARRSRAGLAVIALVSAGVLALILRRRGSDGDVTE